MSKWTKRDRQYSSGHFNMEEAVKEREARERNAAKTIRYISSGMDRSRGLDPTNPFVDAFYKNQQQN